MVRLRVKQIASQYPFPPQTDITPNSAVVVFDSPSSMLRGNLLAPLLDLLTHTPQEALEAGHALLLRCQQS